MTTPSTGSSVAIVEESPLPAKWDVQVVTFAKASGKTIEFVNERLKPLVGDPGDDAAGMLADINIITDSDLQTAFSGNEGIPIGVFRTHLHVLRGQQKPVAKTATSENALSATTMEVLPQVPDDASFAEALKVGGVLKVGITEVLSAIKAGIASKLGLYQLPEIIKSKMEEHAEAQGEPVNAEYFALQKLVTSRSYAEVFKALDIEGNFMSEAKKKAFLQKMDDGLWAALYEFHQMVSQWQETWQAGMSNPSVLLTMIAGAQAGNHGIMPPNMIAPPDTAGLHSEAEAVYERINKVFAGVGIPVARALAYDATRIKGILENDAIPAATGFLNRDQMLKGLGVAVGSDYVRLERNLARYAMAVMEFQKVTVTNEELVYLVAMFQLGGQIPWDRLDKKATGGVSGIGGRVLRDSKL